MLLLFGYKTDVIHLFPELQRSRYTEQYVVVL